MPEIDRRFLAIGAMLVILSFAGGVKFSDMKNKSVPDLTIVENLEESEDSGAAPKNIKVYISGDVEKPGVYEMASGSRVYQAIEKAVARETADLRFVGMARKLNDEETIIVYSRDEAGAGGSVSSPYTAFDGKVRINQASAGEIAENLDGIGDVLARRIVEYRDTHGAFQSVDDLKNVEGIGEKRFNSLKDKVIVY